MISFNKEQDKAQEKAKEEIKKKKAEEDSKTKDQEAIKKLEEEKKKKEEEEKKAKQPKKRKMEWGKLASGIIGGLIELILMFIVGARVLFACKIAQFNVLPTDINCMPYYPTYDSNKPSPDFQNFSPEASIDKIYIGKGEDATLFATKIKYEINNETMKFKILDYIRKMEYKPNVGPLMKYLLVVITNLFVFFYGGTSVVFNKINELLPEWAIILLGPLIVSLFLLFLIPVTFISSLIISLINMKWLLHRNMNTDDDYKYKNAEKPVWMYIDPMSNAPNFFGSVIYIIIGLIFAFNFGITPIPYLIGIISFLTPMFMKAIIVSGDQEEVKNYGFGSSIKGLIETKLFLFAVMFGLMVISKTNQYGTIPAVIMVSFATIFFLYRMYVADKSPPKTAVSDIVENVQNKKFCGKPKMTKKELMESERDKMDLQNRFENETLQDRYNEIQSKTRPQSMKKSLLKETENQMQTQMQNQVPNAMIQEASDQNQEQPGEKVENNATDKIDAKQDIIEPKDLPEASQEIKPETEVTDNSKDNQSLENTENKVTPPATNNEQATPVVETTPNKAQKGGQNYKKREKLLEKKLNNMRKSMKV